jgi:RNA polymerase sigma-70 factor (ECF subfamily)
VTDAVYAVGVTASDRHALNEGDARRQEAQRVQELAWIDRALTSDDAAFRCLVERHQRGVHGLVGRMIHDRAEADDLVQETFARAYCALEQFDPRYRFSTWLYRIALNLCRDHRKSAKRRERPAGLDAESILGVDASQQASHELKPDRDARLLRLRVCLEQLSPTDREVIVLKDLQDLSFEELREITGTPITALKIRALRARARLAALMEGHGNGST